MVPVKIQCECGQKYAFDAEPVNGRMPTPVACPVCGADGTAAANEFISRQLAAVPAAPGPIPQPRLATARAAAPVESSRRGMVDLDKAEQQAKAKIMWGESREQVAAFLTVQGLSRGEAAELAEKLSRERAAIVRSNGMKKTIVGLVLMCVPVGAYFAFRSAGAFPIRRSIWCYIVGIAGAYMFVTGILAVVAPKSEGGAVAKE